MEVKTCEEYVLKKLSNTEQELDELQSEYLSLKGKYDKTLELIEIIKNTAKVQYSTIWISLYDVKDKQYLLDALGLKEEEQPNE